MSTDTLLTELADNYNNRDPLKARLVVESVAGESADQQQAVVALLSEYPPEFAVPLLGTLLDLPLRDLAIDRFQIASHTARQLMAEPQMMVMLTRDAQIHAITALGEMNDERALKPLRSLLVSEPVSPNVRFTIYESLSKLPMQAGGYMLAAGLQDEDGLVRVAAARAIEKNLSDSLAAGIINMMSDEEPLPTQIVEAVARAGALKTLEALLASDRFAEILQVYLRDNGEAEFLAELSPILYKAGRQSLLAQVGAALSETDDTDLPLIYAVDDSKTVLRMFQAALGQMGCRIRLFENPFEAIEWVNKEPPDLLFTDLNMPEMDGIELTSTLRSDPGNPDFPIVLVTTQSQGEDVDRAFNCGVDSFIQKPFSADQLAGAINDLTDHTV